jgi:enediyne biosynthesis protein E4
VIMDYPSLTSPQYFTDVTANLGLTTTQSNATTAFADINNDSYMDMLVSGALWRNDGGTGFTNITAQAGLAGAPRANAFVDIDNDGDLDILFLMTSGKSRLFVNDGSNTFTGRDLSLPDLPALSCFSMADINNDKLPDLFVGQLWSKYDANGPDLQPNYLFLNNGALDFTLQQGKATTDPPRRSRGSCFADFDNDGDLDLYVSNYYLEQDELWQNTNGVFANVTDAKNVEKAVQQSPLYYNHGTGVDWADYDNDGDMDILSPQFCHPQNIRNGFAGTTIYRNDGAPGYTFTDLWGQTGIEFEETHASGCFGDVNNDGLVDLMMTVYYNCRYADFYIQQPDHTFEIRTFDYGLDNLVSGEDAAFVDFDNDGDLDLAFADRGQFRLFRNTLPVTNAWVDIDLRSTSANMNAIGARVTVFAGGQRYMQEVVCGRGQRVEKPLRLHFGLGAASAVDSVLVRWPGRLGSERFVVTPRAINLLREGTGTASDAAAPGAAAVPEVQVLPRNGATLFTCTITEPRASRIELYNLLGVRVATLPLGDLPPGRASVTWNNADERGARVPAGVYLYRFISGGAERSGKFQVRW